MTIVERRRSLRHPADWAARYRYDTASPWRPCRIVDVSSDGAALELYGSTPDEVAPGSLHLQICSVAAGEAGVTIRARLRRHVQSSSGKLIVGIEFAPLAPLQRNLLQLLVGLRARA